MCIRDRFGGGSGVLLSIPGGDDVDLLFQGVGFSFLRIEGNGGEYFLAVGLSRPHRILRAVKIIAHAGAAGEAIGGAAAVDMEQALSLRPGIHGNLDVPVSYTHLPSPLLSSFRRLWKQRW